MSVYRIKYFSLRRWCFEIIYINTVSQLIDTAYRYTALYRCDISLIGMELGVRDFVCEITIICKQKQSLGFIVKSSDRENSYVTQIFFYKVNNSRSVKLVFCGWNISDRLIKHYIILLVFKLYRLIVNGYIVCTDFDFYALLRYFLAVHLNSALLYHSFCGTSWRNTAHCYIFL